MAAINDLIAQIEDRALRERLKIEAKRITKNKKFGLVFEEHLPELTPLYNAEIREGSVVAKRGEDLTDLWRVLSIADGQAECRNHISGETSQFAVNELMVVAWFGDPIFPTLTPVDKVQNGKEDLPWHTLIEAENYHALQLLEYLHAGQVDCIYIDPPYNTGARDWKYNNNYADSNDTWRHSKWLAMMKRRLKISRRLLNPETGVLIVTIDEHEVHHLCTLLQEIFPEAHIQMVTDVINYKGVSQGHFARVEEYIIYVFMPMAYISNWNDRMLGENDDFSKKVTWASLLRRGSDSYRQDSPNLFYPILIDEENSRVIKAGDVLPLGEHPDYDATIEGYKAAWPVRTDLSEGRWSMSNNTLNQLIDLGYVSVGEYDPKRKTWPIKYLYKKQREQIERGDIIITGRNNVTGTVEVEYAGETNQLVRTVWYRNSHNAGTYGTDMIKNLLNKSNIFSFPKSLYAVHDALGVVVKDKPNALILDFFAGSGTTYHAVDLLNAEHGGHRRCILVTNNEVSVDKAQDLQRVGYQPGDPEWEKHGICQAVTWPRCKYAILGHRDDGTEIEGDYFTGKFENKEKNRNYYHISFTSKEGLSTVTRKKQFAKLIDGVPQSVVKSDSAFILSDNVKHYASVLFDDTKVDAWIDALSNHEHITDFYIITENNETFNTIKNRVNEELGPMIVSEEVKRPIKYGFASNLEYYYLEFLEKDRVALGKQFREILPLLWLRSGAIGPRPELSENDPIPPMILPENSPFAVLIDDTQFADFFVALESMKKLTHVYLVTDSEEAFQEMAERIKAPNVIQLYKDYIENFVINKGER